MLCVHIYLFVLLMQTFVIFDFIIDFPKYRIFTGTFTMTHVYVSDNTEPIRKPVEPEIKLLSLGHGNTCHDVLFLILRITFISC